jgi:4'-phosphopantetheinyl transferase
MNIYWLEQTEFDVPTDDEWLTPAEVLRQRELHFAKRRADWRLGRWTAKRAVSFCLGTSEGLLDLAEIEIRAAPSGAPQVIVQDRLSEARISLSHSSGRAVCAVALSAVALGCDLEKVEPRSDTFVEDYFTAEEQESVARSPASARSRLVTLLWSGKESALKALHEGLRLDTRFVTVRACDTPSGFDTWNPLNVWCAESNQFCGWWQCTDEFVRTVVSEPASGPPIVIDHKAGSFCAPTLPAGRTRTPTRARADW